MIKKIIIIMTLLILVTSTIPIALANTTSRTEVINNDPDGDGEYGSGTIFEVPAYVKIGDILCMDKKPFFQLPIFPGPVVELYSNDHCALYVGDNKFIHASFNGVTIDPYWTFHIWAENLEFATVLTNQNIRDAAVDFAIGQIGKPYQLDYDLGIDASPDAEEWYCAELVWASYFNQGIDLDYYFEPYHLVAVWSMLWNDNTETYNNLLPGGVVYNIESNNLEDSNTVIISSVMEDSDDPPNTVIGRYDFDNDGEWDTEWTSLDDPYYKEHVFTYPHAGFWTIKMEIMDSEGLVNIHKHTFLLNLDDYNVLNSENTGIVSSQSEPLELNEVNLNTQTSSNPVTLTLDL